MSTRFYDTTGKRVRLLRTELGMKQGDLADAVGIRNSYLSEIESDKATRPAADIIARLAVALNTTTDYLLLLSSEPSRPEMMLATSSRKLEPAYA